MGFRRTLLPTLLTWLMLSSSVRAAESPDTSKAMPEISTASVNWAPYQIIDIHAHIGSFKGFDLSDKTLLSNLNRYKIRLALISNIDGADLVSTANLDEIKANQATVSMVTAHPELLRGLLWTRPQDGAALNLEPFTNMTLPGSNQRMFVGMKFHPEFNHFSADDHRLDKYMKLCELHQLPAVFHCGVSGTDSSADRIYALAKRHPKVPVVLYHMGFDDDHTIAIEVTKAALTKGDAQLYLETSQADFDDVMEAIQSVGIDHVLFGSDATYFGSDHYGQYAKLIEKLSAKLSASDFAKLMHGNAVKLFNLNLPD